MMILMIPTSCLTYTQAWLHLIAFGKNSISDFKQKKNCKKTKTKTFASTQNKVNWNSRDSFGVFGSLFNLFF
jgi:hypothetical protein